MKTPPAPPTDLNRIETWTKYRKALCTNCLAGCCRLPVEVWTEDLIRMGLIDPFEKNDPPKQIAKRLRKAGIIDHFNYKNAIFILARRANEDCLYLDEATRRCTIYDKRPQTCRNHPQIGPRHGYCAYQRQN